jgi:hypothetical protein
MTASHGGAGAPVRVFRVVVRGQFKSLTERARAMLAASVDDHDIFRSAFTEEGTLTYDRRLQFFNLRYEVRTSDPDEDPASTALAEAERFLQVMGLTHGPLKAVATDMATMTRAR